MRGSNEPLCHSSYFFRNGLFGIFSVKVAGELTKEQKQKIVEGITKVLQEVANKPPEATYVVIEEISRDNWGKAGKLLSDK